MSLQINSRIGYFVNLDDHSFAQCYSCGHVLGRATNSYCAMLWLHILLLEEYIHAAFITEIGTIQRPHKTIYTVPIFVMNDYFDLIFAFLIQNSLSVVSLLINVVLWWYTIYHSSRIRKLEKSKKMDYLFDEVVECSSCDVKATKKCEYEWIELWHVYTINIKRFWSWWWYSLYYQPSSHKDLASRVRGWDPIYAPTKRQCIKLFLSKWFVLVS